MVRRMHAVAVAIAMTNSMTGTVTAQAETPDFETWPVGRHTGSAETAGFVVMTAS